MADLFFLFLFLIRHFSNQSSGDPSNSLSLIIQILMEPEPYDAFQFIVF